MNLVRNYSIYFIWETHNESSSLVFSIKNVSVLLVEMAIICKFDAPGIFFDYWMLDRILVTPILVIPDLQ